MRELVDALLLPSWRGTALLVVVTAVILMRAWYEQRHERARRNQRLHSGHAARDRRTLRG